MNEIGVILIVIGALVTILSSYQLYVYERHDERPDYEVFTDNRFGLFFGLLIVAFGIWITTSCVETEVERLARENKAMRVELLERRKPSDREKYLQTLRMENQRLKRKLKDP